ncbi:MAG: RNA polymerase sigma factor [Candidatus Rifleibacteriota bacterium]
MNRNFSDAAENDNALIKKMIEGDTSAFEPLVKRYWNQVFFVCMKYLKNSEQASDAAQETFISAFTAIEGFDNSRSFKPWLLKIAVNKSIRQLNKDKASLNFSIEKSIGMQHNSEPAKVVEERQFFDDCISRLELDDQILFILRHGLDLAYDEIAVILEKPVGSVKGELFRARKKLKDLLEKADGKEVETNV